MRQLLRILSLIAYCLINLPGTTRPLIYVLLSSFRDTGSVQNITATIAILALLLSRYRNRASNIVLGVLFDLVVLLFLLAPIIEVLMRDSGAPVWHGTFVFTLGLFIVLYFAWIIFSVRKALADRDPYGPMKMD